MNDHPASVHRQTCATTDDQRASLIEDIATLVVLQHRQQQRHATSVEDQQHLLNATAKERIETRQD